MVKGDPGLESIYEWTKSGPAVPFRGATGKGDGVHVLSGNILAAICTLAYRECTSMLFYMFT